MSRHSDQTPKTVADLVAALQKIDQSLPVLEPWDGIPGWFEVDAEGKSVVVGIYLDDAYAEIHDKNIALPLRIHFGFLELPDDYDRDDWPHST